MTPVTNVTVSVDQTSTNVTGLSKYSIMLCNIILLLCASSDYYSESAYVIEVFLMNTPGPFIPYIVSVVAVSAIGEGKVTSTLNFTREGGQ